MKVSKATAAAHREALLSAASTLYRENGFDAVSTADIGGAVGLTHGAVYGHFASKEALQTAALAGMFGWTAEQVRNTGDLGAFLDLYLSRMHVDNPGAGCPFAALAGDAARARQDVRDEFARGLENLVETFAALVDAKDGDAASRAAALSAIASIVGAVVLARASGSRLLGDELLATMRERLGTTLAKP